MSKEQELDQEQEFVKLVVLWIDEGDFESTLKLRRELKSIRTTLPKSEISRVLPSQKDKCPYVPYIATPSMIEEFVGKWDSHWDEKEDFSLAPMLVSMHGLLKEATVGGHKNYAAERGFYRLLMILNLLQSNWKPEQKDSEAELIQATLDRDFIERLKRFVGLTGSDTWRYFANQQGVDKWKIAQAEVLVYMETSSSTWRRILQQTRKDLRQRALNKEMGRSEKRLKGWEERNWSDFRS